MPYGSFYFGKDGFFYKKMGGAGGRRNPPLGLICNAPQDVNNRFVTGSGVGACNISNRRALIQRAVKCSPFCKPGPVPGPQPIPVNPCPLLPEITPYQVCSPWPQVGGIYNNNNRRSPFLGSQTNNVKWQISLNYGDDGTIIKSSPIIDKNNTIYISTYNNDTGYAVGVLYAINDGIIKWSLSLSDTVNSISLLNMSIGSDGTIYTCSENQNNVYAINSINGTVIWTFTTDDPISENACPTIGENGIIYIGAKNVLYAINKNGSLLWKTTLDEGYIVYTATAIGVDGTIYIGSGKTVSEFFNYYTIYKLYAINKYGQITWSYAENAHIREFASLSSPTIDSNGVIYIIFGNYLYAINNNGTLKWTYANDYQFYLVRTSPAIDLNGVIYVGSSNNLLAINSNGTLKWSYTTENNYDIIYSSPAIGSDGTIYFGTNTVYAINNNGTLKWSYNTDGLIYSSPAIGSDGTIYIPSDNSTLYAINTSYPCKLLPSTTPYQVCSPWPHFRGIYNKNAALSPFLGSQTGLLKWNAPVGAEIYSSPAIANSGTIYVGGSDNNFYAFNADGSLKWSAPSIGIGTGVFLSSPAIGLNGNIYIGCTDSNLYAFSSDGNLLWTGTTDTGIAAINSSPVIGTDGTIYVGCADNYVYAFNQDGSRKWKSNFSAGNSYLFSSIAINSIGDTLYIGCVDANMYALNSIDGTIKWAFPTSASIYSTPAISSNGIIYIGSSDNNLYAITDNGLSYSLKWSIPINFTPINSVLMSSSVAIDSNGILYVGSSSDGILYSITDNGNSGTINWQNDYGGGGTYYSSPSIGSDGTIYIGFSNATNNTGELIAVNSSNGLQKWNYPLNNLVYSSPAIGSDGSIYIGSNDNSLYAIK